MPETVNGNVDLETLYDLLKWPSAPHEPGAQKRFQRLRQLITTLLEELGVLSTLTGLGSARILDLMAGGCIAGAAAASGLAERGVNTRILCVDARKVVEESSGWLQLIPEPSRARVEVETLRGDVTRLPELLSMEERWDIALVWGSPLPHLSPYQLLLLLAALRELQPSHGAMLIEQNNLAPRMIAGRSFRDVFTDGDALFVYRGWNPVSGMAVRLVYKLPAMEYIGVDKLRLWDIADAASQVAMFYKKVSLRTVVDYARVWVIAGLGPRENAPGWSDIRETIRELERQAPSVM